jgi:hypothetical protein
MFTEITFVFVVAVILAACGFLLRQQRAHYESILRDVRADNLDLRARMFASKGYPPPGVDMKAAHEEKQAERQQRRSDPAQKSAPDPAWRMRRTLADREKKRLEDVK